MPVEDCTQYQVAYNAAIVDQSQIQIQLNAKEQQALVLQAEIAALQSELLTAGQIVSACYAAWQQCLMEG